METQQDRQGEPKCCPESSCSATCCARLLSQLGVPDPNNADFYSVLTQLIGEDLDPIVDIQLPYPARTLFVSPSWDGTAVAAASKLLGKAKGQEATEVIINNDVLFNDVQDAIDYAVANLNPTAENGVTIIVYTGNYRGIDLAPGITIQGLRGVNIGGLSYAPVTTQEAVARLYDVNFIGPTIIDYSGVTSTLQASTVFDYVTFAGGPFSATLRSSVSGLPLQVGEHDLINIRECLLVPDSIDITTTGSAGSIAQVLIVDSVIDVPGAINVTGAIPVSGFLATPATKRVTLPSAPHKRVGRTTRRRDVRVQQAILPPGIPVNTIYFEASYIDQFLFGSLTLNDTNALIQSSFLASDTGDAAVFTVNGGVLNAANISLNPEVSLALTNDAAVAMMNSNYTSAQVTSTAGAAMDRSLEIGNTTAAAVTGGGFGLVLNATTVPPLIPYVHPTYFADAELVGAVVFAAAIVKTLAQSDPDALQLALTSTGTIVGTPMRYELTQEVQPLPFV